MPAPLPGDEDVVELERFALSAADVDPDPGRSERLHPAAFDPPIGVHMRDHHPPDRRGEDGFDAGRGPTVVDARLQVHVERPIMGRTAGGIDSSACGCERLRLGMRKTGAGVETLADDPPGVHDQRTHERVR
jgi:hypothetical protein